MTKNKRLIFLPTLLAMLVLAASIFTIVASATTVNVLDGNVSMTDTKNTIKVSNGTVTATAKGGLLSKATNIITITNNTGTTATLSFDYTVAKSSSFEIDGSSSATSGSYKKLLAANESVQFKITSNSGFSNLTVTLTINNISLVEAATSSNVTINFDSALGSVTAGGVAVNSNSSQEVSLVDGITLEATVKNSTTTRFLGWIDMADNSVLSTATSFTLTPSADMTVKAAFTKDGGIPWFGVGGAVGKSVSSSLLNLGKINYQTVGVAYLFDDFNAAMQKAANDNSNKAVVLMNNGTLPSGNYTIPSGVTLLIPFDDANTLFTTEVLNTKNTKWTQPTAYRTLTLADGAKITVNGALSLSAKQSSAYNGYVEGCAPTGATSFIHMNGNSSITINSGGALYAWGFITGNGSVIANNGATVYECLQMMGFRGGSQATDMDNGVFPFSQYYVQNIEVPLTLYSGASEVCGMTIYMSEYDFPATAKFIGKSGSLFNLTSGYIIKDYDETTDRLKIDVYGTMTLEPINLSLGTGSINSKDYDLAINSNMTVGVKSGASMTIKQDLALLPGVEVIVDQGATITLDSNYNVYIYDADQWGNFCYGGGTGNGNQPFYPITYVPGRTYTRTEADLVDAKIQIDGTANIKGSIYTTAGDVGISSSGTGTITFNKIGTQEETYQLEQGVGYTEIPITSAKLLNSDGSYAETANCGTASASTPLTMTYTNGKWVCADHTGDPCTVCGYISCEHEEVVDAAKAPTCTQTGLTEGKHCSKCNKVTVAQAEVAALGHTEETLAGKAATCTETGLTEGKKCTVCGVTTVAQEEISALGHTEQTTLSGKAATCTATGLTEEKKCTVCGEVLVAQEEIPAKGHTEETVAGKDATCTSAGLTAGKKCSVCGEILTAQEEIPAKGHTEEAVAGKDATCTESGLTAGVKCSVCGATVTAQTVIPATGHSFGDWDEIKAATEDQTGEKRRDCENCDFFETETIPVLSHDCSRWPAETLEAKAPTCAETGLTEGSKCSDCGSTIVAQNVIPALGHTEETLAGKAATCTETGLTEGKKCTACGETTVAQEEIPALGHTEQILPGKAATCTETGLTDGKKCTACGETTVAQEEISAKGHTKETITGKAATCTATGLTDGEKCSVCGEILTAQEEIPATGHTEETIASKDATCTESGLKDGVKCSVCGVTITAQEVIPATGHTEVIDAAVNATCTETGLTEGKHCSVCGEVLVAQEVVPAKGHTEVIDEADDATCTETGMTEGKHCSVCGEVLVAQEEIPAKGHTEVIDEAVAVTCTNPGKTEGKHCSVCGVVLVAQEVIPNPGHDYKTEVTAPTCTKEGYTTYTCSVCSDTYTADKVSAVGHAYNGVVTKEPICTEGEMTYTCDNCGDSYTEAIDAEHNEFEGSCKDCGAQLCAHSSEPEEIPAVEASCLVSGKTAGERCLDCGKVTKKPEIVPATGHSYSSEDTKDVTCTENGILTFTCEACGHSYTEVVVAPGHNIVTDAAVEPTCSSVGLTQGSHCEFCGEVFVAQGIIPKLKHTDKEPSPDHICDDCEITIGIHKAYSGTHDCAYCGKPASECVDSDADSLCDVCGKNVAVAITFVDYYGSTTKYYGVGENIAFPEILTESYSFELEFLGWDDGSGNVVTEATATTDATYTAAYKIIGFKTESLQLSVEYGAKNAADEAQGIIMYATLFVYTDATGVFTPIVMRGEHPVEESYTFNGTHQSIYMYRFAFTAEDIAENETYISIGIGNCVRHINQVLFKYAESLSGIVGDGESTEAVMTAQQKLIESMIRYGGAVQDCFEEDHSDVETNGMLEATSAILSGFDKLDAERFFRDDNNSAINTHFEAATGVFGTMISLEYYYTVTLNVQNPTNVSVGVIVADSKAELENLSGAFNSETTSTAKLYASETTEYGDKEYYVSTTDGMTINEMEDKYAIIYVTYTVGTETYHHYGDIVEYGIERFAQRQIKDYSPKSVGGDEKTVSADKSYNTAQYVNMLLRILNAHEAAETLEALRAPQN